MGVIAEIQNDLEKGAMRLIAEYKTRLFADAVNCATAVVSGLTMTNAATLGGGIYAEQRSAKGTVVNCLFADNADSGVSEYAGAPEWTGTAAATWSHCAWTPETPQSATIGADSIYVDPLFKNPARLNFRLQRTSPLVNAGLPSTEVKADATDFYGNPRVINRVPDIGCSECLQNGFMLLVK